MFRNAIIKWERFINSTSPQLLLIYTFAFLITVGTVLLSVPFVQAEEVGFLDALFTATSAACVTGLSTIDIGTSFNWYGQAVILALIQFGGVGLMTFAAISFAILGARLSLNTLDVLDDTLSLRNPAKEFIKTFKLLFYVILVIELIGAFLIFFGMIDRHGVRESIWNAFFLSVSAFCNAGFTLFKDSLASTGWFTQSIIMVLIVLGGLGHIVLTELYGFLYCIITNKENDNPRWFSYHVRVVLFMTVVLLCIGAATTYIFNYNSIHISWFTSIFQSVTARTAGFATVNQRLLSTPSLLIIILLMLVGGGAGSCAGGLKTTTLAVWIAKVVAMFKGTVEITFLGMKIPNLVVVRVTKIVAFALVWNICGLIILSATEELAPLQTLIFEQISAFATVGLSLDFTDKLSDLGQVWIIITMFVGRLGTLTFALAIPRRVPLNINHPEGRILVG